MTITLDQYHTLRRRAERLRQKAAEADGALKEVLRQIKEQFGCSTLKEAKALLAELEAKERKLGARYAAEMKAFTEKWSHVLGEEGGAAAPGTAAREAEGQGREGRPKVRKRK